MAKYRINGAGNFNSGLKNKDIEAEDYKLVDGYFHFRDAGHEVVFTIMASVVTSIERLAE